MPGDVARAEAERLNGRGLGDANLELVGSRVEEFPPEVPLTTARECAGPVPAELTRI